MAGSNIWGAGFHDGFARGKVDGITQGRVEGVIGSAVVVTIAGAAYGAKWFLDKRNHRKLAKLEAERVEGILKRDRESKNEAARNEQNEA